MKLCKVVLIFCLSLIALALLTACGAEHTHEFGEWQMLKNPTCNEKGERARFCECGMSLKESVPITDHNYVDYVCSFCGDKFFSDGLSFSSNGDGTCYVSWIGACKDSEINVPLTSPAGDTVTAIGDRAFEQCYGITKVTIPSSVTRIGDYAFFECCLLNSVELPDSITSVGIYAFSSCSSLTGITIPSSVTSIGEAAFADCYSLVEVCNKSGLTILPGSNLSGFAGYYAKNVIWEESQSNLKKVDDYVFYDDGKEVVLVKYIGREKNITLPQYTNGKQYIIGEKAFYLPRVTNDLSTITSVKIPECVQSIGKNAFSGCSSLTTLVICDGVTNIGDGAFSDCRALTNVSLGASVTSIGASAFARCNSLNKILIPNSVVTVGENAFTGLGQRPDGTTPKVVYYTGTEEEWETLKNNNENCGLFLAYFNYVPEE